MKLTTQILATVLVILFMSCSRNNESEKNIQLINELYIHFNNHQWKEMASLYSEKAQFLDPSFGEKPVLQTHKQIIEKYSELNAMFPNLHDEVINIYTSENQTIIVEFISTGTSKDGMEFSLPICTIFEIENGKIIKDRTYYDSF